MKILPRWFRNLRIEDQAMLGIFTFFELALLTNIAVSFSNQTIPSWIVLVSTVVIAISMTACIVGGTFQRRLMMVFIGLAGLGCVATLIALFASIAGLDNETTSLMGLGGILGAMVALVFGMTMYRQNTVVQEEEK